MADTWPDFTVVESVGEGEYELHTVAWQTTANGG